MKPIVLVAGVAAVCLSGCAVVSDVPLFDLSEGSSRPLADGLWAMSGPGCEVRADPAGAVPDCAAPVSIEGDQMRWDTAAALARTFGSSARAVSAMPMPKASAYRLIDGDPNILEFLNGATNDMPPPAVGGGPARPPLKPSYMGLKGVHVNAAGRVDKAILWPVLCPPAPGQPGFEVSGAGCRVTSTAALRERATHVPLAMSFFMTWIRTEPVGG